MILKQSLVETFLNVYGANDTLTLLCFSQLLADFHDNWKDSWATFGLVEEELSHIVSDSTFKFTPVEAVSCQVIFNGSIDNVSSLTENVTALLHINEPTCIHTRLRDNLTFLLVNSDSYDKDTIYPDPELNAHILEAAKRNHITVKPVKVHSSDVFYTEPNVDGYKEISAKHGCACVEMESFALFANASVLGKEAACLLTISDSFISPEITTAEERQTCFTNMMKIALENL